MSEEYISEYSTDYRSPEEQVEELKAEVERLRAVVEQQARLWEALSENRADPQHAVSVSSTAVAQGVAKELRAALDGPPEP